MKTIKLYEMATPISLLAFKTGIRQLCQLHRRSDILQPPIVPVYPQCMPPQRQARCLTLPPRQCVSSSYRPAIFQPSLQEARGAWSNLRGDIQVHQSHRRNSWWRRTGCYHPTMRLEKETRPARKAGKSRSSHSLSPSISGQ